MANEMHHRRNTLTSLIGCPEADFSSATKGLATRIKNVAHCSQTDLQHGFNHAYGLLKDALKDFSVAMDTVTKKLSTQIDKEADESWDTPDGGPGTEEMREAICLLVRQRWMFEGNVRALKGIVDGE